jgi:hypothetical protein
MKADDRNVILLALLAVLAGLLVAPWRLWRRKHAGRDGVPGFKTDWRDISDRIR